MSALALLRQPQKLDIIGTSSTSWLALRTSGVVKFYTSTSDGSELRYAFNMGGTSDAAYAYLYKADAATIGISLNAGGDTYFNGGNFGIGTASPGSSTKLQVAGRGLFTGGTHDPGDGSPKGLSLTFESDVGVIRALQTAVTSYDIAIQPTSGGNVGIGTTVASRQARYYRLQWNRLWNT